MALVAVGVCGRLGLASVVFERLDRTPPPLPPAAPPNVHRSLSFRANEAIVSDTLTPGQIATYQFSGQKGQTLTVNLEGSGLEMTLDYEDDKPIDSTAAAITNGYWRGTLPATGTYFVYLKTIAGEGDRPYRLALTLAEPPPRCPPCPA
ncbi:MAG: serine/threonine protein kinase, partial [Oscillatoriales cyanobacterium SM2_1_8]|nr:serine/threonine protein kinase [Oscillatoriales cyanobacterium SM2_1_8]